MCQLGQDMGVIICGGYLSILAVVDIRQRKLPVWLLLTGIAGAVVYQAGWSEVPLILSAVGGLAGLVFLVFARITGEAFGYGDGALILALGIYLGFWNLMGVLTIAFILAAGFSMIVLALKKFQRKATFPFVPFMCIGYFLMLGLGGI